MCRLIRRTWAPGMSLVCRWSSILLHLSFAERILPPVAAECARHSQSGAVALGEHLHHNRAALVA